MPEPARPAPKALSTAGAPLALAFPAFSEFVLSSETLEASDFAELHHEAPSFDKASSDKPLL